MLIIISNILVFNIVNFNIRANLTLEYGAIANELDRHQVFFSNGEEWREENSMTAEYISNGKKQEMVYTLPRNIQKVRIDVGNKPGEIIISDLSLNYLWNRVKVNEVLSIGEQDVNDIESMKIEDDSIIINSIGEDPFFIFDLKEIDLQSIFKIDFYINIIAKIFMCIGINILIYIVIKKKNVIKTLTKEIYNNRILMWNLSKNDFKTKYAGSYLGIFWAFVQPIVTVLIYWFVFEVGFKSIPIDNFPFVLWLVVGIVPWFFFNEAIINATNSLVEYSYLVKKVVFKISILPIVKIISALFVHLFFVGFTIILFMLYGYMPHIYMIQIIYYSLCAFILALGIGYATCAIVIFFKDLGQIVGIGLQIGMWMTPIMWSYTMIPDKYQWILKMNPMYYIVEGYRDTFINKVWFWSRYNQTIYFWIVTISLFGIGTVIFKKLKGHFADVL